MKIVKNTVELVLLLGLGVLSTFVSFLSPSNKTHYNVYVSCNDERYRKPYIPVDEHLVPLKWLYVAVLVVLPLLILIVDIILCAGFPKVKKERKKHKLAKAFEDSCNTLALYYSGLFILMLFCKLSQFLGGTPAPYFLTLCSPGCSNVTGSYRDETTSRFYITQETCSRAAQEKLRPDTLSSFPSIHAALTCYAAAFVTVFYYSRGTTSYTRLLQPSIAALFVGLSIVTSMSRINEYSNHTEDVVGEAGIGILFAAVQITLIGYKELPEKTTKSQ
ncbi:phospholipid phosphatase-related protein type 5-like [Styela clava]